MIYTKPRFADETNDERVVLWRVAGSGTRVDEETHSDDDEDDGESEFIVSPTVHESKCTKRLSLNNAHFRNGKLTRLLSRHKHLVAMHLNLRRLKETCCGC